MSNSVLEQNKSKREFVDRHRGGANLNSAKLAQPRKQAYRLQPVRNPTHQPSQTSLSEANPILLQGANDSKQFAGIDSKNDESRSFKGNGPLPIMRLSSNQPTGQLCNAVVASQDASQQKQKLLLRFLSSDDCNTSQSIFSSTSRSGSGGRGRGRCSMEAAVVSLNCQRQHRRLADSDEADLDSCPKTDGNKEQSQTESYKKERSNLSRNRGISSDPYFSSNGQQDDPKSSTYYGTRPQALYQSLVTSKLTSVHHDSSRALVRQEQSGVEILDSADGKTRNMQGKILSQTQIENDGTSSLDRDRDCDRIKKSSSKERLEMSEAYLKKQILREMPPMELTSVRRYYSLKPDMAFGWRPEDIHGAPIPMYFDYEQNELPKRPENGNDYPIYFLGNRFNDSLDMHQRFANKVKMLGPDEIPSYNFKFPPNQNVIEAMGRSNSLKTKGSSQQAQSVTKMFKGMSPLLSEVTVDQALPLLKNQGKDWSRDFLQRQMESLKEMAGPKERQLIFDSSFESGNLDMAIQVGRQEYDMYMRVDSNTRGHHQWFYFKVLNQGFTGKVKFNFVNFTKRQSLYSQGMRVNVKSMHDFAELKSKLPEGTPATALKNEGWVKCGENIDYKLSKLSQYHAGAGASSNILSEFQDLRASTRGKKKYYMLTFDYTFKHPDDEVYFAYALPYTFSKLHSYVREVMDTHSERVRTLELRKNKESQPLPVCYSEHSYIKEARFCHSLSGLEVPELTITSQVNKLSGRPSGAPLEIDPEEFDDKEKLPVYKDKKYMIIAARVHPGESNASYIMQGFLKYITGHSQEAVELRKRIVFKVVPMTNPDGVIAGNYRTSLSGNDLNRQFLTPSPKLHPTVDHIKKLCRSILSQARLPEPFLGFIDIHGHSRKKSVFMYGPHFPLHNERYFKSKVLPKLLDERTQMFRFYSCKFRIERSKLKTARVVLFKEFGIMNCFTLEASFHGFIDKDRTTTELTTETLQDMGANLGGSISDYANLHDQEEKQKSQMREALKQKKKKLKARDITKAIIKSDKQQRGESVTSEGGTAAANQDLGGIDLGPQTSAGVARLNTRAPQGVRSLSIQNNSTKVSSYSDTHSDGEKSNSAKAGASTLNMRPNRNQPDQPSKSHQTEKDALYNAAGGGILTSDIMELISEEELSVCRSEGSPPRKPKKRQKQAALEDGEGGPNAPIVDMVTGQAAVVPSSAFPGKKTKAQTGKKSAKGTGAALSNFRLRPDRTKRLSDAGQSALASENSIPIGESKNGGSTSMQAIMDRIKSLQDMEGSGRPSDDDEDEDYGMQDDESSCGKSFSGDELSENELRAVQGDILGAIKHFDDLYNKKDCKEKYSRERNDQRKVKKLQQREPNRDAVKENQDVKRRKKSKRDDLMMAAKHASPAVTMPFQVKGSGNGGNSCTLVMERIMQQRQQAVGQQQPGAIGPGTTKRPSQEAFGFMQRHKKSLNPSEKELYNRAITDINFNVPKSNAPQNLEPQVAKQKQAVVPQKKARDSSQNSTSVPVGLKGLAAISDMRNSKNAQAAEAILKQAKFGKERDAIRSTDRTAEFDYNPRSKGSLPAPRSAAAPKAANRLLKLASTSVVAKSPTNGNGSVSGAKSSKLPRSTKPIDGFKKQSIISADEAVLMPPLNAQVKQTPMADSFSEQIKFNGPNKLSKSQSKTIQVSPPFLGDNLPQVQQPVSTVHQVQPEKSFSAQKLAEFNERLSKGILQGSNPPNHNDLEQPKIISMTLNINQKPNYQHISHVTSSAAAAQEYVSAQNNNNANVSCSNTSVQANITGSSFRVKPTTSKTKRSNLSSQRCSSGNIGQRNSKVSNLMRENAFLNKVNNGQILVLGSGQQSQNSSHIAKQNFSIKTQQLGLGQPDSQNQSFLNRQQLSCPHSQRQRTGTGIVSQQQVSKTIGSHQNLKVISQEHREELERMIVENLIESPQQSASAFAMINSRSNEIGTVAEDGPSATYSQFQQNFTTSGNGVNSSGPSSFIHTRAQNSHEQTLLGNSLDLPSHQQPTGQPRRAPKENFPLKSFIPGQGLLSMQQHQNQLGVPQGKNSGKVFSEISSNFNMMQGATNSSQMRTAGAISINSNHQHQHLSTSHVTKQSNSSMRVRSLGKQTNATTQQYPQSQPTSACGNPAMVPSQHQTVSKASNIFSSHLNGGSGSGMDQGPQNSDLLSKGTQFQKLAGLHKFVTSKQSKGTTSTAQSYAVHQMGNQLQQHLMQRRRNLKAPSVHSMSATGINRMLNTQSSSAGASGGGGGGGAGGPGTSMATLNMSAHNVQELISQAVRREAGLLNRRE